MQALYDLQKIARLSDSFLLYQDIEERIIHAIAAKLEEFNVMKTKPIHNCRVNGPNGQRVRSNQ